MAGVMQGDAVVPGTVQAVAMVATEPLSFWGGYDAATGEIVDRRHPLSGQCAAGRVLVLPGARGSSTGTAVLLESVRAGKAPAALITDGRDAFFALAAIVSRLMYGRSFVVVAMDAAQMAAIPNGAFVRIAEDGRVSVGGETAA